MERREFLRKAVAVGAFGVSGCEALPRSGPTTADMQKLDEESGVLSLVAPLTAEASMLLAAPPPPGFPDAYLAAAPLDPTRIGVDDVLDIAIWETDGAGLFGSDGGVKLLEGVVVDPSGRVFVPFAGAQKAAGLTIAALRERLRAALDRLTLSPQVDVRLREPRSRAVTVQGAVGRPGVYTIDRVTARLGAMLAQAGGATETTESIEVVVQRGEQVARQILADVMEDPRLDIALRAGDQIVLTPIRERFMALGASSIQAEITFPTRPLDLLSAIGAMQGLRDFDADPTGVFVFRYEEPAIADRLLEGSAPKAIPTGPGRPIVYRLDLSQPQGFFVARAFEMRDGDAVFITNAPLTELRKFLQLFNTVVTPVSTVNALQ